MESIVLGNVLGSTYRRNDSIKLFLGNKFGIGFVEYPPMSIKVAPSVSIFSA
jgi:hypothetical protein